MIRDRVTVQEAARRLGVKDDAIRKRIQRGSLQHDKGLDGRVYVYLEGNEHANGDGERDGTQAATQDTLLAALREEVDFLRGELERKDAIILALTSRIPGLEAPRGPRRSPETVAAASREPVPGERPLERPWWRRMFGG